MIRSAWLLSITLTLAGCDREPAKPQRSRPDWSGAEVEGVAPLMAPEQVEAALRAGGYAQVRCSSKEELLQNPLYKGERSSCYASVRRPFRIILQLLDLAEGRRLVEAYFFDKRVAFLSFEENLRNSKAFAEGLRKRFGSPADTFASASVTTYYWHRPGGDPQVRDKIRTEVSSVSGANVRMESRWAHDEPLSSGASTSPGNAASRSR
ncbi:hypothetical protein [Sphingomonas psychrotolerans]|nr:hypothetical protein [Sphingomonas psychrotolerans]